MLQFFAACSFGNRLKLLSIPTPPGALLYEYMYSCSSTGTVLLYSRTVPVQLYVQLHGSMYDATRSGAPVGDHRFRKFTVNNDSFLLDA
jgi:hypothetical protein